MNLLIGLVLISIPVVAHLRKRRRQTDRPWGAMRFLVQDSQISQKRLQLEHWLLLLLRMLILACVVAAFMMPPLPSWLASLAELQRNAPTASIILLDDSMSQQSGRDSSRWQKNVELTDAYVAGLRLGDRVTVLRMSQLDAAPIVYDDMRLLRQRLATWKPSQQAGQIPELLTAGVRHLAEQARYNNVEMVLVTDGDQYSLAEQDQEAWGQLKTALSLQMQRFQAENRHLQLVCLQADNSSGFNIGIESIVVDQSMTTVDAPVAISVRLRTHGREADRGAVLRVIHGKRTLFEQAVQMGSDTVRDIEFSHQFKEKGSHVLSCQLEGSRDHLRADDRRHLIIDVVEHVPVLLVDASQETGLQGSTGFVQLALEADREQGQDQHGIFKPTRVRVDELAKVTIDEFRVVVLADIVALDPDIVAALESYVAGGGTVLVSFGPDTDATQVNRFWGRAGDGFLPVNLEGINEHKDGLRPVIDGSDHPALTAFDTRDPRPWQHCHVRRWFQVSPTHSIQALLSLSNGSPLLLESRRGLGAVLVMTSTMDPRWNDLPLRTAFVPLVRGLILHASSYQQALRHVQPGQRIIYTGALGQQQLRLHDPFAKAMPMRSSHWRGRSVQQSDIVEQLGIHRLYVDQRQIPIVANVDPRECELKHKHLASMPDLFGAVPVVHVRASDELPDDEQRNRNQPEAWPWLLVMAVLLLVLETNWLAQRQADHVGAGHG